LTNLPGKNIDKIGPIFLWVKYLGNSALPSYPGELSLAVSERVD
jgi:hypothetical protein